MERRGRAEVVGFEAGDLELFWGLDDYFSLEEH